jgi:hypothetical protein
MNPTEEPGQQDLLADAAGGLDTSNELEASQHPGGTAYGLVAGATSVTPAPASAARPRSIEFTPTTAEIGQQQQQQQGATPIATATITTTPTTAVAVGQRPTAAGLQAAARRVYLGVTQEAEHALLKWQSLGKNDAEAQESFREELGRSTDLQILVAAPAGSTVLTVIHSVACFFNRAALDSDLRNAIVGFVGDRSEFTQPTTIRLEPSLQFRHHSHHLSCCLRCNSLVSSVEHWAESIGTEVQYRVLHCGDGQTKARLHPTSERESVEALILCGSNRSTNASAACRAFARIVKLLPSPHPLANWRLLAKGFWGKGLQQVVNLAVSAPFTSS